ncbi:MAG: Pyridoxal 5'-phosphate synthase subunit PdxS [Candidatus Woesearchaeota archaeon]|nr:Pyridoxal 5'-phosphate synthase subunit PdxS [Candidatus Woesearchaeota archaeon]
MPNSGKQIGTHNVKIGLADMLKGGVIMDVATVNHAKIAEEAGAVSVMALEKIPADVRASGGVARTAPIENIETIMKSVSIPVMAKVRIGHYMEARVIEQYEKLGIDFIDESEVLTPVDIKYHINKLDYKVPFVCGARNLGEALRRMDEGAAMIRTKGEPGTGDVKHAVEHIRIIREQIAELVGMYEMGEFYRNEKRLDFHDELLTKAREYQVPYELVLYVAKNKELPVPNFAAGGIATPQDAALMMYLGADGIFVGSGIFKAENPDILAKKIVEATTNFDRYDLIRDAACDFGEPMSGTTDISEEKSMQIRSK